MIIFSIILAFVRCELLFVRFSEVHKTEINLSPFSRSFGVVGVCVFVEQVKISFQPLDEFEIVLVLRLGQLFDLDVLLHFTLGKTLLKDFVVVDEFPFILCLPVNPLHGNFSWEHRINNLAVNCPCPQLLNAAHF